MSQAQSAAVATLQICHEIPEKAEEVAPDELNLLIFFTHAQALKVMVDDKNLCLALQVCHLALKAGQGD